MTSGSPSRPGRAFPARVVAPVVVGSTMLLLAVLGSGAWIATLPATGLAIGASAWMRTVKGGFARELWIGPTLLSAVVLGGLARPSLPAELVAGAVALATLFWLAEDASPLQLPGSRGLGLLIPGLASALAISVTLFLPGGPALIGVASLILAGALLGITALLTRWPEARAVEPSAS